MPRTAGRWWHAWRERTPSTDAVESPRVGARGGGRRSHGPRSQLPRRGVPERPRTRSAGTSPRPLPQCRRLKRDPLLVLESFEAAMRTIQIPSHVVLPRQAHNVLEAANVDAVQQVDAHALLQPVAPRAVWPGRGVHLDIHPVRRGVQQPPSFGNLRTFDYAAWTHEIP